MRRIRSITVRDKEFNWYVKSCKQGEGTGKILVIQETTSDNALKETPIFVANRNIGPKIVKSKIQKFIIGDNSNVKSIQSRRPKISERKILLGIKREQHSAEKNCRPFREHKTSNFSYAEARTGRFPCSEHPKNILEVSRNSD